MAHTEQKEKAMNGRFRNQNWIYIFALVGVVVAIYVVYQFLTA